MENSFVISEFVDTDKSGVEECIVDLQEHERKIDSNKKPGVEVAAGYLEYLLKQCAEKNGKIFVAKVDSEVVGFSCVWVDDEDDPTSNERKIGYFSDLYTKPEFRRQGVGISLIKTRLDFIKSLGISLVRVCTLADNKEIQETLKSQGFVPYEITWELSLKK